MTAPSSYRSRALRGGGFSLAGYAVSQGLNFATYAIVAHLLTPEDLGVYAAGALVTGIAMLFAESGILAALVTRKERVELAADTAFVWTVVAGFALMAASAALSPLLGLAFDDERVTDVTAAMSGILLIRALVIVPDALLQRRLSFIRRVVIEPLGALAFSAVAIYSTSKGAGYWGLVLGTYALMVVQTSAGWLFVRWRPRPRRASWAMFREMAGYARMVLLSEVIRRGGSQLDTFLVGRFIGLSALGQYNLAGRLASVPLSAWVSIGAFVLFPIYARLSDDAARLRAAIVRTGTWMATGAFPLCLLLAALGLPGAVVVFGDEWRVAGQVLMALAAWPIGRIVISLASEAFKASNHPEELPKVHAVTVAATAVAVGALLPFGVVAVAAGTSVASVASGLYALRRLEATVGVPVGTLLARFRAPLSCSVAMACAGYVLDSSVVHAADYAVAPALAILAAEAAGLLVLYVSLLALTGEPRRRMLVRGARLAAARVRRVPATGRGLT